MRPWDESEEILREAAERREAAHDETLRELEAEGIDLAPEGRVPDREGAGPREPAGGPGGLTDAQRHRGLEHASDHAHPHAHVARGDRPVTGIVGAGAVGTALGVALDRAGWPVRAVASRDVGRRDRFRSLVSSARAFAEATALVDEVELVILAVPDDVVVPLAGTLRLYAGQALIHTSGLLGADALTPAMAAGTQAGAFHPLVAFADLDRAVASLQGATIAIEGDDELAAHLAEMAEAIGGIPVRLAPGSKAAYHAAAVLSAGAVVALLDTIREVAEVVGLDEEGALRIYLPLLEQTVANARALGIAGALTGPATRGDAGTIRAHLDALAAGAPAALPVYRALLDRSVAVAEGRGALSPDAAAGLRGVLAADP